MLRAMLYFIVIYGTRGMTSVGGMGQFHCPSCGESAYRHKKVRRWFTLFFIPVIPLDLAGEYVECGKCYGTYELAVLSYDPAAEAAQFEAAFHIAIRRTMVKMCLADGVVDPEEVATIREIYSKIAGVELSEDDVREEIAEAMTDTRSVQQYLQAGIGMFNLHAKELILKAAFFVAAADGEFQEEEQKLLNNIGAALQMTKSQYQAVIDKLTAADAAA
jgi:DnaJ-domain-containing protein 1